MALELSNLSADDIEQLKAVLGSTGGVNRSPGFKPLRDLRPATTAKGRLNRPHFEWSAEDDGHTVIPPFPRLFWTAQGVEVRIEHEADMSRVGADWTSAPPVKSAPLDPMARVQAEFDLLAPDDQAFVLEQQKKSRLNRLHELMSGLSEADLAGLNVKAPEKSKKSA